MIFLEYPDTTVSLKINSVYECDLRTESTADIRSEIIKSHAYNRVYERANQVSGLFVSASRDDFMEPTVFDHVAPFDVIKDHGPVRHLASPGRLA